MSIGTHRAKRAITLSALIGTASLLAGCTTFGSNINGDFSCGAPEGSCAPSTTIDDAAIATIQDRSSSEAMNPAGPYEVDDGDAPGMRLASAKVPSRDQRSVPRAGGRVLRVVFPAYVDRYGQLHEKSAVQAEVDVAQVSQLSERAPVDRVASGPDAGLFGAADSAPQMLALATPQVTPAVPALAVAPRIKVQLPEFTPASAAAKGKPVAVETPIDAIKNQVAQKLAQSAKLKATDFPAAVE